MPDKPLTAEEIELAREHIPGDVVSHPFGVARWLATLDARGRRIQELNSKLADVEQANQTAKDLLALLVALNTTYAALDVRFEPTLLVGSERCMQGRTVVVPYQQLLDMAAQPLLKVVLNEAPNVASLMSVVVQDGQPTMDGALFMQNLSIVMAGVYTWVDSGVTIRQLTQERRICTGGGGNRSPRGPRTRTGSGPAVGVVGRKVYQARSAQAAIYRILMDGAVHTRQELYDAAIATGVLNPKASLQYIVQDGPKYGGWTINMPSASAVQMVVL